MLNKKVKFGIALFIFLILVSWNINAWIVSERYHKATAISDKIDKLIDDYPNISELKELKTDIEFINDVCFEVQNE